MVEETGLAPDTQGDGRLAPTVIDMDLLGVSEIAEMLGVSRQRAHVVATSKGFPDPVAELAMGRVWLKSDVDKWLRKHRPHLGEK